jgi:prepilin-type N-terminal cleavage/methylation domain-containing protein
MHPLRQQSGFSLVELSIVLVILGLLTGGILGGQALIRAAELRSVSADFSRYQTAAMTFRDKYFALPGDMSNATAFWGAADSGDGLGNDCTDIASNSPSTCNGNGNGLVESNSPESFRFWQHLANAALIEGSFTGRTGGALGTWIVNAGLNSPSSKISSSAWSFRWIGPQSGDANTWARDYGQGYGFGRSGSYYTLDPILSSVDTWNIDTKIDDGKPGLGRLVVYSVNVCSNTTDGNNVNAEYLLNSTTTGCSFLTKFD